MGSNNPEGLFVISEDPSPFSFFITSIDEPYEEEMTKTLAKNYTVFTGITVRCLKGI